MHLIVITKIVIECSTKTAHMQDDLNYLYSIAFSEKRLHHS